MITECIVSGARTYLHGIKMEKHYQNQRFSMLSKMKIRIVIAIIIMFAVSLFVSCDDNTQPKGEGIRYEGYHKTQSDEEFANFRMVSTTGMGNVLYRSSSPVTYNEGRGWYAAKLVEEHGINTIINFSNTENDIKSQEYWKNSYYSKQDTLFNYIHVGGASYTVEGYYTAEFKQKMKDAAEFIAEHQDGIYLIHCRIGRDRTGLSIALFEALLGATEDEIRKDYAISYSNLEEGYDSFDINNMNNISHMLEISFGVTDLSDCSLESMAEQYFLDCGVSESTLYAVKENLSRQV